MTMNVNGNPMRAVASIANQPTTGSDGFEPPSDSSSLLPAPAANQSGSVVSLAILMTRVDQQEQAQSKQVQDAAEKAAAQDDAEQVDALKQKGDDDFWGAFAQGLGEVAQGGASIAGATAGSQATTAKWNGAGEGAAGVGKIVGGFFAKNADIDQANATGDAAAAQAEISRANGAQSDAQAAADSVQKVIQYLQATLQTEAAARAAAARS